MSESPWFQRGMTLARVATVRTGSVTARNRNKCMIETEGCGLKYYWACLESVVRTVGCRR